MRIGSLCDNFVWNEFGPPRAGPSEGEAHGRASNPFLPRQETELLAPFFVGAD